MDESREQLPDTVTSIGFALAEAAYRLTRFPAAVVVSDPTTQVASVVAASVGTDRRLLGRTVALTSAAGRACIEDVTTYARDARELLGRSHADRRQREEHGIAMSLLDGRRSVGALIVFAPTDAVAPSKQEQLGKLAGHAGHLIGKNLAVQLSQQLGLIDAITGQRNGPGLRGWNIHGASLQLHVDNGKVYHANQLKKVCFELGIDLIHRPVRDPAATRTTAITTVIPQP